MSEKITVDFKVNSTFSTEIDSDEIIESLNSLPIAKRWNAVAQILNQIQIYEAHELEPKQRELIVKWLESKLDKLKETITILDNQ